jgi:glycosyltransferase involved in cell wall biosynthesis
MNILSMVIGRDGCSGYRMKNPLIAIQQSGDEHQVHFVEASDDEEKLYEMIIGADVLIFRQNHDQFFHYLKTLPEVKDKLFVVDMDDDIFRITPFADTYRWGGVEEVEYEGKMLWKNGENNFDTERNRKNLDSCVKMLEQADLITCTTEYLKERLKELAEHDRIEVLPNAIDLNHWKKWPLEKGKQIRIGWTGGATHYIDWYTIKDPLKEVFDKYKGKVKLVIQGNKWDGTIKGIDYEHHGWIDFEGHPYKTASLNLDIAVIPLKDTLFNKSKSCIKWYEFSALGVPSLVSNVIPYSIEIKDGETAMAYNNGDEFIDKLSKLIDDTDLRKKLGENALEWIKKNRDLKVISKQYIQVFKKYATNKSKV